MHEFPWVTTLGSREMRFSNNHWQIASRVTQSFVIHGRERMYHLISYTLFYLLNTQFCSKTCLDTVPIVLYLTLYHYNYRSFANIATTYAIHIDICAEMNLGQGRLWIVVVLIWFSMRMICSPRGAIRSHSTWLHLRCNSWIVMMIAHKLPIRTTMQL